MKYFIFKTKVNTLLKIWLKPTFEQDTVICHNVRKTRVHGNPWMHMLIANTVNDIWFDLLENAAGAPKPDLWEVLFDLRQMPVKNVCDSISAKR